MRYFRLGMPLLIAAALAVACGSGGGGGGGQVSIVSGTYKASNATIQQDQCGFWSPPTQWTGLDGTTAVVTVGASSITYQPAGLPAETFVKTGNVWDAHFDTPSDNHYPPVGCITHDIEDVIIQITANNQFRLTDNFQATMVSGTGCSALTLPCSSSAYVDYVKQ